MIARVRLACIASITTVALALLVTGAPQARAQVQACCQGTYGIPVNCTGPGCSGNITIQGCDVISYGEGYWYDGVNVYCCSNANTTFVQTSDTCWIEAPPQGQLAERVWVRDCKGRYALLTVPIRAYPA